MRLVSVLIASCGLTAATVVPFYKYYGFDNCRVYYDSNFIPNTYESVVPLFTPSYNDHKLDAKWLELVPDRYIVKFKSGTNKIEINRHIESVNRLQAKDLSKLGVIRKFELGERMKGYIAELTSEIVTKIRHQYGDIIDFIERDSIMTLDGETMRGFKTRDVESGSWNQARISHRPKLDLETAHDFLHHPFHGNSVADVYILDTGIDYDNDHLIQQGTYNEVSFVPGEDVVDRNGHGTAMAGLVGGEYLGVTYDVTAHNIKVLNELGRGFVSYFLEAFNYVYNDAATKQLMSIILLSVSGAQSKVLNEAVDTMVTEGFFVVTGAGTRGINACHSSPAGAKLSLTVSAMTILDEPMKNANWGPCVDLFAPGLNVKTAALTTDDRTDVTRVVSGSSAAAAQVAGLIEYFIANEVPPTGRDPLSPAEMKQRVINFSTKDKLLGLDERTPNLIAFNGGEYDLDSFYDWD